MAGSASSRNTAAYDPDQTAPSGRRLSVVVVGPVANGVGHRRSLDAASLLLGRAPDNDLVLDESSVSARHARIDVEADGAYLTDLGSTNGTWFEGRRVTAAVELTVGSTFALGRCELRVEAGVTPAADAEVATVEPATDEPWARTGAVIPARRPLRLLVSFDQADAAIGERIVERLERIGHHVLVDRSTSGDGWAGRLLDAVWSSDAAVFVVSAAAAVSERVHREVHLAAAEHTTVIGVLAQDAELPPDLAYYLERQPPVDLRRDPVAGLSELQRRIDELTPKRIARPWRLARRVVAAAFTLAVLIGMFWMLRG